mmetsp:Transcript_19266/g.53692  ORF Transcript_19266/g.53692 Transcript_19266/m.53692 type:complete len:189 (-) Transcript_19266:106-672(-)
MSAMNFRVVPFLAFQLLLLSTTVEGFQNVHRASRSLASLPTAARLTTRALNTKGNNDHDDDDDDDDDSWTTSLPLSSSSSSLSQQLDRGKFNPLDYQRKNKTNRPSGNAQAQVSLRSLRMTSLTDDILNSLGDQAAVRAILEENKDFLLEPLESEDSLAVRKTHHTTSHHTTPHRWIDTGEIACNGER